VEVLVRTTTISSILGVPPEIDRQFFGMIRRRKLDLAAQESIQKLELTATTAGQRIIEDIGADKNIQEKLSLN
jgi:hypothetical protein